VGEGADLDGTDWALLAELREDGRLPVAALAARIGVSRATVYARMERLRTSGVLEGFSARVNPAAAGFGITAYVLISGNQASWRRLIAVLEEIEEVEYCALTTGEFDVLVQVRMRDVASLRSVVLERLAAMEEVRSTVTIFALQEVIHRPYVVPSS
jgi:DNA-binding Lrp family transcriptional regulator